MSAPGNLAAKVNPSRLMRSQEQKQVKKTPSTRKREREREGEAAGQFQVRACLVTERAIS